MTAIAPMTHDPSPARRRVAPLAPDDRRAALIAATLPLLLEHGTAVSTRQIAQAAGVAEGTIFRVFPDKSSLILAALETGVDPGPAIEAIRAIPPGADLRARLIAATGHLADRVCGLGRLHMIARELMLEQGPHSAFAHGVLENRDRVLRVITALIEPDRTSLRVAPATAARLLQSMIVASYGHMFGEIDTLTNDEIVTVLLDGLLDRPAHPATSEEFPC